MNPTRLNFGISIKKAFAGALLLAYVLEPLSAFANEGGFNFAPSNPAVSGPSTGEPNIAYTFTASANDPEGDQISYGFDWDNDGTVDNYSGYVDSGSSASASHTWSGPGTYTVSVVARDVWGQYSGMSSAMISIASSNPNPNPNPTINTAPSNPSVSAPSTIQTNTPATFTATASDAQGDSVMYGFDWDNDGTSDHFTGAVSSGSSASASHTWSSSGTYTVSVIARDMAGATSGSSQFTITVTAPSNPPVNPPAPINVAPNAPLLSFNGTAVNSDITFTATASDANGDQINYGFDWDNDGVIDGYTGYVASGVSAQLSHSWSEVGTYTVKAYARDIWGNFSSASQIQVNVTTTGPIVVNTAPNTPFVGGSQNTTVNVSEGFTVTSTDPQGDSITYGFDWDNNGVVDEYTDFVPSGISANVSHSWETAGSYTFKVYAKDTWSAVSNATSFTISVTGTTNPPPQPNRAPNAPTVTSNGTAIDSNITFTATATDPDGDQLNYGFDWDDDGVIDEYTGFVPSGVSAQLSHSWPSVGTYTVAAHARDIWGNFSTGTSLNITVTTSGPVTVNTAPNLPIIGGNTAGVVGISESFTVTATDPQGDDLVYGFDWDNDGTVDEYTATVNSGISQALTHTWNEPGTYTFKVIARDVWSLVSTPAVFTITISSPVVNLPPSNPSVMVAGSTVNSPITFTALSTDPEGDQISYGFDWDNDGQVDEYSALTSSGVSAAASHVWTTSGTYTIKVYARDAYNHFSGATTVEVTVNGVVVIVNTAPSAPTVAGPTTGYINESYTFVLTATDPQNDEIKYSVDWNDDGTIDEYTAFVPSGTSASLSHSFNEAGIYTFKAFAQDNRDAVSNPTTFTITISNPGGSVNQAPLVELLDSPAQGTVNTSYSFTARATDPENNPVSYAFDWDNDGSVGTASGEEWSSEVPSGTSITRSNSWSTSGTKTYRVFARDSLGAQSSASAQIVITGGPSSSNINFTVSPASGLSTSESGATAAFTVVLDSAPMAPVELDVQSSDLTEGTTAPISVLTFTPTNWNVSQTVIVTGVDDTSDDGDVTYSVLIGPAVSQDVNWSGLGAKAVSLVNIDNDGGNGGGGNNNQAVITSFTLNPNTVTSGGSAVISWASSNSSLCVASNAWTGNKSTSGSESVGPFTTDTATTTTFSLACGNSTGTTTSSVTLTINPSSGGGGGDPVPDFILAPLSGLVTSEGGLSAVFTIRLSRAPGADVMLPVTSSDFSEGTTSTSTVLFTSSNWSTEQTVTVTGIDDSLLDGDVVYTVVIGNSTSTDSVWNNLASKTVSVTNTDNEGTSGGGGGGSSGGGGGGGGGGNNSGPCYGFNCPATTTPTTSGPGIVITFPTGGGSVAGATTGPEYVCSAGNYLTVFMRIGADNIPGEVRKLQTFLNTYENAGLEVSGEFDVATETAVKNLQSKYSDEILAPWGVTEPTGIVYLTTTRYINMVVCDVDLKDNVLYPPATTTDGVIGQATSTTSIENLALLGMLKDLHWYAILIILLIILGSGLIISAIVRKDRLIDETYTTFIKGAAVLAVGTVLNVLNSLSFILNPEWFTQKTGLTLTWLIGLDIFNLFALIVVCLVGIINLYTRSTDSNQ